MAEEGRYERMRLGADIAERLLDLGAICIDISMRLPRNIAGRHLAGELVRASTSTGANYEEARAAESRQDFIHKASVAAKEARESGHWLSLIQRCKWIDAAEIAGAIREATELAAILGASVRTARHRATNTRIPP